jgi:hypothetical protein
MAMRFVKKRGRLWDTWSTAFSCPHLPALWEVFRGGLRDELADDFGGRFVEVRRQVFELLPRQVTEPQHEACVIGAGIVRALRVLKSGGLCCHTPGWGSESRIPLTEGLFPFIIQHPCPNLEQEMRSPLRPSHLLLLFHPFADDLVDG